MKRLIISSTIMFVASVAFADVPVIDKTNYAVARHTAEATDKILNTNKEILTTVEETLKAVTGDRSSTANPMQNLAVGNGFSVSSIPSCRKPAPGRRAEFWGHEQRGRQGRDLLHQRIAAREIALGAGKQQFLRR